jgi:hypothetical protein
MASPHHTSVTFSCGGRTPCCRVHVYISLLPFLQQTPRAQDLPRRPDAAAREEQGPSVRQRQGGGPWEYPRPPTCVSPLWLASLSRLVVSPLVPLLSWRWRGSCCLRKRSALWLPQRLYPGQVMTCFVSLTSVLATRGGTCTPGTRLSVGTFCLLRPLTSPLLLTGQLAPHRPAQMVRILGYLNIPSSASWLILNHVFSFRHCALAVSSIAALAEALASAGAGASSSGSGGSAPATAPTSSSTTTGDQSGAGTLASLTADPLVDSIIEGAPAPAPTPHVSPTVLSPFSVVAYTDCEV